MRISSKTHELIAPILYRLLPADVSTVVGISSISGIYAIAGLPSAVDVCDVPIVSAAVAGAPAECCCLLQCC